MHQLSDVTVLDALDMLAHAHPTAIAHGRYNATCTVCAAHRTTMCGASTGQSPLGRPFSPLEGRPRCRPPEAARPAAVGVLRGVAEPLSLFRPNYRASPNEILVLRFDYRTCGEVRTAQH
eukprot:1547976-Pleurochrysis_carterae.AAC.2